MGVIDTIVGGGMGMATAGWNDRRQLEQAKKLQKEQIKGAKEMGKFNQQLAMETWENTNYAAQRKQLEKAGLNVGLMYEGGGAGGTTSGGSAAMPSGQSAVGMAGGQMVGMGMQLGLQQAMQQATIDLTKAQTDKVTAEAQKIGGVDTEQSKAAIDQLKANTENTKVQKDILNYEKGIKEVEQNVAQQSQYETINLIKKQNDILEQQINQARTNNEISAETAASIIQQTKAASVEQGLRISAQKQGLIKGEADINAVNKAIAQMTQNMGLNTEANMRAWDQMSQQEREIRVKEAMQKSTEAQQNFNTSTPAQIRQWTEIIGGLIGAAR